MFNFFKLHVLVPNLLSDFFW